MILTAASAIYGAAAQWRRRWYSRSGERQRRLARPVISVGNLSTGGSGKTPIVEHLARVLLLAGERPAILTRGYGRRVRPKGVTVVSDGTRVVATFDTAGDEPLMLARSLPGVPVLVGADRYASGRMAEERFSASVHLLDDGFQHVALARDVDLLAVAAEDLLDRVLPAGHLREPLAAAAAADALLVSNGNGPAVDRLRRALRVGAAFHVRRTTGQPYSVRTGEPAIVPSGQQVFAFAGIARPERFFKDVATAGWRVAGTMTFADHHRFTEGDIGRVLETMRGSGTAVALTTAKDAVRLEGRLPPDASVAAVPLTASIEPAEEFRTWLLARVRERRAQSA